MSQYILSLFICVVNNRDQFFINLEIHNISTRQRSNLHLPSANLDIYQKGVHYSGIAIFKTLPFNIKKFSPNVRIFKSALKYLIHELLFLLDKYYNNNSK
jgi:hypothetical protein